MNLSKQAHILILLSLAVSLVGCPDPEGELDSYLDRVEMVPAKPDMSVPTSGCGEFEDPTGTYFVSVNTNLAPGTPLLFEGQFVVDTTVEPRTAQLTLVPLTVMEKTPIEDLPDRDGDAPVVSPVVPIDDEGKFEMDLGTVIVTGLANAVSGSEIEAVLAIQGQILNGSFVCGSVTGDLIRPSAFDLGNGGGGSTFAMKSACGASYADLEPTLNCLSCEDIDALSCDGGGAGGAAGMPQAGTAGMPEAGTAGMPEAGTAGMPEAGTAGMPEAGAAGMPEAGAAGMPEAGAAGMPEAGAAGMPEAGAAGMPEAGTAGMPEAGTAGMPEAGTAGMPEAGTAGMPEAGTAGSTDPESGTAAFGEACEAASDCLEDLTCANINGNNEGPFCTRNCSDANPCPENYRCSSSLESAICLPN